MTAALAKVESSLDGLRDQLERIEGKVTKISTDVEGHAKWIHTTRVVLGAIGAVLVGVLIAVLAPLVKKLIGL